MDTLNQPFETGNPEHLTEAPNKEEVKVAVPEQQLKEIEEAKKKKEEEKAVAEKKAAAEKDQIKVPVVLNNKGVLAPTDLDGLWRMANLLIMSKALPQWCDNPAKLIVAHQMASAYGLDLMAALRQMCMVNGVLTFWGELPLAIVLRTGLVEHIDEYLVDKDYKKICFENKNLDSEIFAAICEIQRRGREKKTYSFTTKQADKAIKGIAAIWKGYDYIMMKRKVRTVALKDQFPDVMGAMPVAEYDHEASPDIPESMPKPESDRPGSKFLEEVKNATGQSADSSNSSIEANEAGNGNPNGSNDQGGLEG